MGEAYICRSGSAQPSANLHNALHNSNFEEWVAQVGIGGLHYNQAYGGDRWILIDGTITGDKNPNGNGYHNVKLNGTIKQIIYNPPKNGSVFIEMISGSADISYDGESVMIVSDGGVIKNASLFEGEYTEQTKPHYQKNDFISEMFICQSFFRRLAGHFHQLMGISTTNSVSFLIENINMRAAPTVSVIGTPNSIGFGYFVASWLDGLQYGTITNVETASSPYTITIACTLSGVDIKTLGSGAGVILAFGTNSWIEANADL